MYQNTRRVSPLNWPSLVEETLRRRKTEKITQRRHAALANVSVPTMAAFERKETTLSLTKVFDILRVVGLLDEQTEGNRQDIFVNESLISWSALVDSLPENVPARFPYGCFRFDYCFEGNLKNLTLDEFKFVLDKITISYPWTFPFWITTSPEIFPQQHHNILECWLGKKQSGSPVKPADDSGYWRVSPEGRLFLLKGYQEDCQKTLQAGSIFDAILPIWHMGEALLHGERLAPFLQQDKPLSINFRAVYSGLNGRVLHAWANPLNNTLIEQRAAQSDEAILTAIIPVKNLSLNLTEHLYPLVSSLYERFGVKDLSKNFLETEVTRLLEKNLLRI